MKKLLLTAVGLGITMVSCGTKESSMSSSNTHPTTTVNPKTATPSTKGSATANTSKMKVGSAVTAPSAK